MRLHPARSQPVLLHRTCSTWAQSWLSLGGWEVYPTGRDEAERSCGLAFQAARAASTLEQLASLLKSVAGHFSQLFYFAALPYISQSSYFYDLVCDSINHGATQSFLSSSTTRPSAACCSSQHRGWAESVLDPVLD